MVKGHSAPRWKHRLRKDGVPYGRIYSDESKVLDRVMRLNSEDPGFMRGALPKYDAIRIRRDA